MLSGMNSVIIDWLGMQCQSCSPRSRKKVGIHASLPFGQGVEIFSAIRMRKKYYSLADCLDGLCSAGYNQSGDGRANACFCSNPIPPVAVATVLPAEHVLSRSAGSEGSSCITINIVRHHSPYKAREFSGYRCHSNIPFLSMPGQPIVFAPKSDIGLVCISDHICWIPLLPSD